MFSLDLLRALAILLITNSHLDPLYPNRMFGTGGMFGNELFFFISGFGLALSRSSLQLSFGAWIGKRLQRILEPLLLATTLMLIVGYFRFNQLVDLSIFEQIFHTYWFLPTIITFYIPLYAVMRTRHEGIAFALAGLVALLCYAAAYVVLVDLTRFSVEGPVPAKAPFYFVVMLAGVYAARYRRDVTGRPADIVLLALTSVAYFAYQFAMQRYDLFAYQFGIHLIGFIWLHAIYNCSRLPQVEAIGRSRLRPLVMFLSSVSLWIYLLQEAIIQNAHVQKLGFPLNIIVFWALVLPAAWLFNRIDFGAVARFFARLRCLGASKGRNDTA